MNVLNEIIKHKIVAIIRGADPSDVLKIAHALEAGGVRLMEITLNSENALELIKKLSKEMKGKMVIGAGTVLNKKMAKAAIKAGARFIISPSYDIDTIKTTKKNGAVSIPGAFTPTEIVNAFNAGADIIKVFPASGNVTYIRELRAPLSQIPLMPTGGINVSNIRQFLDAGAIAFGIGTSLVNTKEPVTDEMLYKITLRSLELVNEIKDN